MRYYYRHVSRTGQQAEPEFQKLGRLVFSFAVSLCVQITLLPKRSHAPDLSQSKVACCNLFPLTQFCHLFAAYTLGTL